MARVLLKKVSKTFPGGIEAVKDVKLEVADKEFLVLVGPSGCGKSTTLRMVAGLEEITSGEIFIGDTLINDIPSKNRDIAMVFQNYALYPHMNVYKNMAFGLILRKYPKSEIDRRVQEAAEMLGISELLNRLPKALSGGQRQRVAVGRSIVRKPKVFLFDEPLSNLDAKMRVQMRVEISKLHIRLQSTMIYVTHDQVEAMTMGDRIVVMKDGIVHQVANPINLYEKPVNKFVAGFIGSPSMNFINGTFSYEDNNIHFRSENVHIKLDANKTSNLSAFIDKKIILGARPENISIINNTDLHQENLVKAKVEVIEAMGSETLLHLSFGNHTIITRVGLHNIPHVGENLMLKFDIDKVHFFDEETEKVIF